MAWKIICILALVLVLSQIALTLSSWRTPTLGIDSDSTSQIPRLLPCPGTPNCVCSQDVTREHTIDPLMYLDEPAEAMLRLKALCTRQLGLKLIEDNEHYLRLECVTSVMRYVDDLEFLLDAEHAVIHVRSASRVGRSDLGLNRKRVEQIRSAFQNPDLRTQ